MISSDADIDPSTIIFHPELVNIYGCTIGKNCRIGSFVEIKPHVNIGNKVKIEPFTFIPEGVIIEDEVFIGAGVTIVGGLTIGKGARIGAGSVVVGPVKAGETVFGNPAQKVKS